MYLHTRGFVGEVLCDGVVAPLLGPLGRGHVPPATDCDITACFHKCANNVHLVVDSGIDEWGIPVLGSDIQIAFILEEQYHDLRVAIAGRQVQRSIPILIILPIDRCPLRNESLGSCRLSMFTGTPKFLVDVQSALQCVVLSLIHI